jgi:probable lipoprotein NlpC
MIFITLDITRAIGLEKAITDLKVICLYKSPLVAELARKGVSVLCVGEKIKDVKNNTAALLLVPEVQSWIEKHESQPEILVFKPTKKIESIIKHRGWKSANAHPEHNVYYEDKIHFSELCNELGIQTPPTVIKSLGEIIWEDVEKFGGKAILQLRRGHAGETSFIINTSTDLETVKSSHHENHLVKLTKFIEGRTITFNNLVKETGVEIGCLMRQVSGIPELNRSPLGTCGVQIDFNEKPRDELSNAIKKIGNHMMNRGYRGIFGIDAVEDASGKAWLIECNARLTASISFHTQLQIVRGESVFISNRKTEKEGNSFTCEKASQIILRNTKKSTVQLRHKLESGIYELNDGELQFIKPAIHLNAIQSDKQVLLLIKPSGSRVTAGIEVGFVQGLTNLITKDNQITGILKELLSRIRLLHPSHKVTIRPKNFWHDQTGYVTELTEVLRKPLKNYENLKKNAIHRNRQTQLRPDEPEVKLLGEQDGYYLMEKFDGTKGWVWKNTMVTGKKPTQNDMKKRDLKDFLSAWVEKPYLLGGVSENGIDCSGLVQRLYLEVWGTKLPKYSQDQRKCGIVTETHAMSDGDLMFLKHKRKQTNHVGIYIDGKICHACLQFGKVISESMESILERYELQECRRIICKNTKKLL